VVQPVVAGMLVQLGIPRFITRLVSKLVRRQGIKTLYAQGTGRHSPDEINAIGMQLLTALSDWLGQQPYMLGDQPRTLDASAYAFLMGILLPPIEGPMKTHLQSKANLVTYCERMRTQYWMAK
jgi:glutathione S-transferase